ncbi:cohesin domain-containing protein [Methanolobus sp. ZRKC5]|uniref:cohesin domain-containing protein n=1 Tax=unclassified Methanolobus TaxID=2629569 RepID=UPI00313BF677
MRKSPTKIVIYAIFIASYLIFFSGMAIAATSVNIIPSAQEVKSGEAFEFDIYIKPDTPIYGLQFDLTYDSSLVAINSIEEGSFFANSDAPVIFNPGTISKSTGTVSQIYSSLIKGEGVTDEGIFCTVTLEAQSKNGPCQLRITNLVLGNQRGEELPATTFDSIITITGADDNIQNGFNNIPIQDEVSTSNIRQDADSNENDEMFLASTPDQAEEDGMNESDIPEIDNSKKSNWIILIFAAIGFFAIAYFLDRKK